jgi:hypothetical protein
MEKIIRIVRLNEQLPAISFWKNKSFIERMEAIEFLRSQYITDENSIAQGLQRVCQIVKRA